MKECKEGGRITGGCPDIVNERQSIKQFTQEMKGGGPTDANSEIHSQVGGQGGACSD